MSHGCLVQFTGIVSAAQAVQLLGKKVLWKGNNKENVGKIVDFHGKPGAVRVNSRKEYLPSAWYNRRVSRLSIQYINPVS
jgi:ribosomal protein L35AE/L33A